MKYWYNVLATNTTILDTNVIYRGSFRGKNSSYVCDFPVGKTLNLRAF